MKTILFITAILFSSTSIAQTSFTISPGLNFNRASIGVKKGNLLPQLGMQYGNLSLFDKSTDHLVNWQTGNITQVKSFYETKINLLMPSVGMRYYLLNNEKLNSYLSTQFTIPILIGKDFIDDSLNESFSDAINKVFTYGIELGFGAEYFFDDAFSISGEFGLRHMRFSYKEEYENTVQIQNGQMISFTDIREYNYSLNPTFTKVSINFYFHKKETN